MLLKFLQNGRIPMDDLDEKQKLKLDEELEYWAIEKFMDSAILNEID